MTSSLSFNFLKCDSGTPLQYSCLENPMDGGAWWAAVHGVARSRIRLGDFPFTFHFHALEKEMATHSSVLAWRIPGTGEPGGLPPMGSQSGTWLKRLSGSGSSRQWTLTVLWAQQSRSQACNSLWQHGSSRRHGMNARSVATFHGGLAPRMSLRCLSRLLLDAFPLSSLPCSCEVFYYPISPCLVVNCVFFQYSFSSHPVDHTVCS